MRALGPPSAVEPDDAEPPLSAATSTSSGGATSTARRSAAGTGTYGGPRTSQRVAEARVDDERPLPEASLEGVVVDDQRVVDLPRGGLLDQRSNAVAGTGSLCRPECGSCRLLSVLAFALLEARIGKWKNSIGYQARSGTRPEVGVSLRSGADVRGARWMTFW